MNAPKKPAFRLNLLENGLDFISQGVEALYGEELATPAPHAYKYALLHIFSGTLLVLKERLRRAHPSLIFQKVAEASKPGAITVDFSEVINRLEGSVGVQLERADRQLLHDVRDRRNAIEHYEVNLELEEVNALVGRLVDFLERFLHDQLEESLLGHLPADAAREVAEHAGVAKRLRERREAEWRRRVEPYRKITRKKLAELAEQGDYHPKHNPDAQLLECPECGEESVAEAEQDIGICTKWSCRAPCMLESCDSCGKAMVAGGGYCDDCTAYMRYKFEKDD